MENTTEFIGGNRFVFWRSRPAQWGIGLAACAVLLGMTNPNQDAYTQHAAWKYKGELCKQAVLPTSAKFTCLGLSVLSHDLTASTLEGFTRRDNYLLFSIYTTDLYGLKNRSIGIAGHFF